MSLELINGANCSLSRVITPLRSIFLHIVWSAKDKYTDPPALETACFILDAKGIVLDEKDFVFAGNTKSKDGSVELLPRRESAGTCTDTIQIAPKLVSSDVKRICIAVLVSEVAGRQHTFADVAELAITVLDDVGCKHVRYAPGDAMIEKFTALSLCEVYRRESEWKFRAVGSGYKNGLKPLAGALGFQIG